MGDDGQRWLGLLDIDDRGCLEKGKNQTDNQGVMWRPPINEAPLLEKRHLFLFFLFNYLNYFILENVNSLFYPSLILLN